MITTINGEQDETTLEKREGAVDHADRTDIWVEYYDAAGTLVHRSVHVIMKAGNTSGVIAGVIGG